jgi:DNA-binding PadR family transcriptional regulator
MRRTRGLSGENAPLTTLEFEILLALADEERHGYGVLLEVRERTSEAIQLQPGTLYRVLGRLHDLDLIEESEERPDPSLDDERRRYYRLTAAGLGVLKAEARRLEGQVRAARAKKLLPRGNRG